MAGQIGLEEMGLVLEQAKMVRSELTLNLFFRFHESKKININFVYAFESRFFG